MLVTTFYLAMTFINAWRMRSLKSHLLKFMSWKSSAVLYKFSSGVSPLKAKLIIERKVHYITDVIEITEATRMCRLRPIQFIDINRWFSIANGLPLWSKNVFQQPDPTPKLCVFIECEMEPSLYQTQDDVVTLESLGQVWAWRAEKNLEFIAVIPFNKLLELCYKFLYGSLVINERLSVTRIQTVYATGTPYQPEDDQINTLKKIIKEAQRTSQDIDWTYYSGLLKHMYREVFVNSNKMAKSFITSVPSQILSPPQPCPESENNFGNNTNHCDQLNHHDQTQELIRALSLEEPETNDKLNKQSPEEQIQAITQEMESAANLVSNKTLQENHKGESGSNEKSDHLSSEEMRLQAMEPEIKLNRKLALEQIVTEKPATGSKVNLNTPEKPPRGQKSGLSQASKSDVKPESNKKQAQDQIKALSEVSKTEAEAESNKTPVQDQTALKTEPKPELNEKPVQDQIPAQSEAIKSTPKPELNKKPAQDEISKKPASSQALKTETKPELNKKPVLDQVAAKSEAKSESKPESNKKQVQDQIPAISQTLKSESKSELNKKPVLDQIPSVKSEVKSESNKPVQDKSRTSSQEKESQKQDSDIKSPQELKQRAFQKQKQVVDVSKNQPVEEKIQKSNKSKQETQAKKKVVDSKKSDEPIVETRQITHTTHESLKPSQDSTSSSRSSTPEILEGTIVRSETVNIRQKLSPSRKRKTKGNGTTTVETTIQSVTTHRRVTSLIPPQERPSSSGSEKTAEKIKIDLPKSTEVDVLVYSESVVAKNSLIATLKNVLDPERYTIYGVPLSALCAGAWRGRAALVAVVGNTGEATPHLLRYFLGGGRLLAVCSDLLQAVVPYYRTAEIRENEIVQFSFDKWKAVKMKHHVLCFQASPAKKQFSSESDRHVMEHELNVEVLATEETWRTPSLVQVAENTNHGVAIFSQIHLETDPVEYLGEEGSKFNRSRHEILSKILGDIISLHVKDVSEIPTVDYTEGYFFGDEKMVQSYLSELPGPHKRSIRINGAEIEWLSPGQSPNHPPSHNHLPVRVSQTPNTFCHETYRKNLTSQSLGRVVLYADVVGSTMTWCALPLHGLAVIAGQQLAGKGRSNNQFISPPGQSILSLQVWQKVNDRIALTQNVAALAVVQAIRSGTPYEELDIRIKWPNDIYCGRDVKIGGVMTTADVMEDMARIYIGIGVNISNSVPTTCVNDVITRHNAAHGARLPPVTTEWFVARLCSQLERILADLATEQGQKEFFDQYYKYWLHSNEHISVTDKDGKLVPGTVHGMDKHGYLVVDTAAGRVTVSPDGNSFNLMANLIVKKY